MQLGGFIWIYPVALFSLTCLLIFNFFNPSLVSDVVQLTLLPADGNGEESDEGHDGEHREENRHAKEELEPL